MSNQPQTPIVKSRLLELTQQHNPPIGERGLEFRTLADVAAWGVVAQQSGLIAQGMSAEGATIALLCGRELGLPPMISLQYIVPINNRPFIMGRAVRSILRRDGYILEERPAHECLAKLEGWCKITTPGGQVIEAVFTKADAERAKLWGAKDNWIKYPGEMLAARALSRAVTQVGLAIPTMHEEADEVQTFVVGDQEVIEKPTSKAQRIAAAINAASPNGPPAVVTADEFVARAGLGVQREVVEPLAGATVTATAAATPPPKMTADQDDPAAASNAPTLEELIFALAGKCAASPEQAAARLELYRAKMTPNAKNMGLWSRASRRSILKYIENGLIAIDAAPPAAKPAAPPVQVASATDSDVLTAKLIADIAACKSEAALFDVSEKIKTFKADVGKPGLASLSEAWKGRRCAMWNEQIEAADSVSELTIIMHQLHDSNIKVGMGPEYERLRRLIEAKYEAPDMSEAPF